MEPNNKLGAMPIRPLLYTMAVPLMLIISWTAFLWRACPKRR